MAKRDRVKDRLEWYRRDVELCRGRPEGWRTAIMDPGSLKEAAKYFGLNHEGTADLIALAHILADVVFGEAERGRPEGDDDRLLRLGLRLHFLERREGQLSDTKAAEELVKEFYEYQESDSLRKQLPAARRELERVQALFRFPVEVWARAFLPDK